MEKNIDHNKDNKNGGGKNGKILVVISLAVAVFIMLYVVLFIVPDKGSANMQPESTGTTAVQSQTEYESDSTVETVENTEGETEELSKEQIEKQTEMETGIQLPFIPVN